MELAFPTIKANLREVGARTFTDIFTALDDICNMFTPNGCWNYFQATG
jgi:hypothetical protein